MISQPPFLESNIIASIIEAIKKQLNTEFDKMVKEFTEKLESRKAEFIAGHALEISKHMDIQSVGERVIITIRKIDNNS